MRTFLFLIFTHGEKNLISFQLEMIEVFFEIQIRIEENPSNRGIFSTSWLKSSTVSLAEVLIQKFFVISTINI